VNQRYLLLSILRRLASNSQAGLNNVKSSNIAGT